MYEVQDDEFFILETNNLYVLNLSRYKNLVTVRMFKDIIQEGIPDNSMIYLDFIGEALEDFGYTQSIDHARMLASKIILDMTSLGILKKVSNYPNINPYKDLIVSESKSEFVEYEAPKFEDLKSKERSLLDTEVNTEVYLEGLKKSDRVFKEFKRDFSQGLVTGEKLSFILPNRN